MTKISRYDLDTDITGGDKWIGTDSGNSNATKNFSATKLGDYYNSSGTLNAGDSMIFKYIPIAIGGTRAAASLSFDAGIEGTQLFQDVTYFVTSKKTVQLVSISDYAEFMEDTKILLYNIKDLNKFGLFRITDVSVQAGDSEFLRFTVEFIEGNDGFRFDETYGLTIKELAGAASAVDAKTPRTLYFDNDPKTAHTGTTANTNLWNFTIPANTIPDKCIIKVTFRVIKTGAAGTLTSNINNNVSSPSAGVFMVNLYNGGNNPSSTVERSISYNKTNSNQWRVLSTSGSYPSDTGTTAAYTTYSVDNTVNNTFYIWLQLSNAADSAAFDFVLVEAIY